MTPTVVNLVALVAIAALAGVTWSLVLRNRRLAGAARSARENEETLQLALEAASEYRWDGDLRSGKVFGSPEAGVWLGYPPAEWPPDPWDTIVHEDDRAATNEAIRKTIRGETPTYRIRHRCRRKDGTIVHAISTGVVVRDGSGRPVRFVGFVRDITREVDEEARHLQTQKLEGLGVLAGGIAHDFNNLLTIIGSSIELAAMQAKSGEDVSEPLTTASNAVTRATTLTRQLLAYAGRGPIAHAPVDLNELARGIGNLLATSLPRKVTLRSELESNLPAVNGNVAELQQVVMNLVTNAAEAIGDAEGMVTLSTQTLNPQQKGKIVRLTVKDSGAGMTSDVQARIFDPFFSTKGTGRGLGLAALAGILKAHAGTIKVESTVGHGTTFTIDLPALDAPVAKPSVPPATVRLGSLELRVLVVDDEAMLRRTARRLLERLGCGVDEAETGLQAVERVRATPAAWHLILMDVTMPEMTGTEAAEHIRKMAPGLPIVLSSGYSTQAQPSADRVFYLPKPYTLEELEAVLREARGSAQAAIGPGTV